MKIDEVDQNKQIGQLFNKMFIRNCIAQKLGFLVVGVNIFCDFETFSNFGICFKIFLKFRDGAIENVNVSCYVYVTIIWGYVWIRKCV